MAKTGKEIAKDAAAVRRAFAEKLRALDAMCREIVRKTVQTAEEAKINEIRSRYE